MKATLAVMAVVTGLAVHPTPVRAQGAPGGQPLPTPDRVGGVVSPAPNQPPVRIPPRIPAMRVSRPLGAHGGNFRNGLPLFGWGYLAAESYATPSVTEVPPRPLTGEAAPKGGLQLAVEPRSAKVYVDGSYVGIVESFSGYYQHLTLPGGPHRIEMLAPAYEPLTLDVSIVPDRTTTYRNSLTRAPIGR